MTAQSSTDEEDEEEGNCEPEMEVSENSKSSEEAKDEEDIFERDMQTEETRPLNNDCITVI